MGGGMSESVVELRLGDSSATDALGAALARAYGTANDPLSEPASGPADGAVRGEGGAVRGTVGGAAIGVAGGAMRGTASGPAGGAVRGEGGAVRGTVGGAASGVAGGAVGGMAGGAANGAVLYLHGELGAGKTTCVRSLLRALGVDGLIRSPTYTLVEVYELDGLTCVHVDLYRLEGPVDVEELGLRDYLQSDCLYLVEWPEKGGAALPAPDLDLTLTYRGDSRDCRLEARTALGGRWLSKLEHDSSLAPYVSNLT
jgi:tRNA threonylcarbamoyladenosine biosynthesis protein TsaE